MSDAVRFAAPWDTGLTIASALVTLLLVAVTVAAMRVAVGRGPRAARMLLAFVVAAPALLTMIVAFTIAPRRYVIDTSGVRVERVAGPISIPIAAIVSVRPLEKSQSARAIRLLGVGGLFGYVGTFSNSALGNFRMYATRTNGRVAVETTDGVFVITPAHPADFVAELRRRLRTAGKGASSAIGRPANLE